MMWFSFDDFGFVIVWLWVICSVDLKVQVGVCIFDWYYCVVGVGYNGWVVGEFNECESLVQGVLGYIYVEVNVLFVVNWNGEGYMFYVIYELCLVCVCLIVNLWWVGWVVFVMFYCEMVCVEVGFFSGVEIL